MRSFRGLTKDGKWVYGWYTEAEDYYKKKRHFIILNNSRFYPFVDGDEKIIEPREYSINIVEVIPETVGQGIVVDGKEFYEGDVTKDDTGDLGVVRFGKLPLGKSGDCVCTYLAFYIQCFGQLGQAPTYECQEIGKWMEVIGTIHTTHPELIKN